MMNSSPSDPYGAKQAVLLSHVGTLYDIHSDLKSRIEQQQSEISELRDLLTATLELVDSLKG
jgi:hypothetical protein